MPLFQDPAAPIWKRFAVDYTQFATAGFTNDIELFSLPAGSQIHDVAIKQSTSFTGGLIATYTISIGITGNLIKYAAAFNVFQSAGNTVFQLSTTQGIENFGAATSIRVAAVSTVGLLNAATQGAADIWLLVSQLP